MELSKEQVKVCEHIKKTYINAPTESFSLNGVWISPVEYKFWLSGEDKKQPTTAQEVLANCIEIQKERAKQYDPNGEGERSFSTVAAIFNLKTGNKLKGSDICLIQQDLKDVRQYADPTRSHEDSQDDKVSYASLHVEELRKEFDDEL